MDGFALAEAVARARSRELPIIALSSISSPESIERGRQRRLPRLTSPSSTARA
jgi:hypothetical protein